jgi:ferrous iron transport protein B
MVPLVVGFGCNVPALAATKTMPDARRRLLTGLLIPFTSCPARLTVDVLVAGVFFPRNVGTVIFAMYLLSALLVVLGGLVLRATLFRDLAMTRPLVLALPAYHIPRLRFLLRNIGQRVWSFVKGAGGIIAGTLIVLWLLTAIPLPGSSARFGEVPVSDSLYGRAAGAIAPVLAPAGLADWRIASSLATGFVAKEAMVASLAQGFSSGSDAAAVDEYRPPDWLATQLRATLDRTSGGHASAAAAAFMVMVLAYTPCVATVAEQKRVFGARWALGAMGVQLLVAWLLAVGTFQLLRLVM